MSAGKGNGGSAFWHKPNGALSWHAYNAQGGSLCGGWVLVGMGRPHDSRGSRPRSNCCLACFDLAERQRRSEGE